MRKKLILTTVLLSVMSPLFAQIPIPNGGNGGCAIKYDYDAAGNRIKRSKYCWAPGNIQRPGQDAVQIPVAIEMQVYPNPASTQFSVVFSRELNNAVIELQDITGKVISSKQLSGSNTVFNIQSLAQGAYLVVLKRKDSKEVMVRKLLKE